MLNTDPTHIDGQRVNIVRNHAEYAAAAGGQVAGGIILWWLVGHFIVLPWLGISFAVIVLLPALATASVAVGVILVPVWLFLAIGGVVKVSGKCVRKIVFADGYRGPTGAGETVWINFPNPETIEPTPDVVYVPNLVGSEA